MYNSLMEPLGLGMIGEELLFFFGLMRYRRPGREHSALAGVHYCGSRAHHYPFRNHSNGSSAAFEEFALTGR
jgi:hypothetical protein